MGTDKRARQKEQHRTRAAEARKAAESAAKRKRMINVTLVAALVALLVGVIVFVSGDDDTTEVADDTPTTAAPATTVPETDPNAPTTTAAPPPEGTAECPAADGSSEAKQEFDGAPKLCIDPTRSYSAEFETSEGSFTVQLDAAKAPTTVNNFVFLARYHYYDDLTFHRIIDGFMIQGGDPEGTGMGGPGYSFNDELPQAGEYEKYSIAMANSGPNTNGSQFFIVTGPQGESLPPSYSLFGKAVDGTNVIDKIGVVETGANDKPSKDVVIKSVTITEE